MVCSTVQRDLFVTSVTGSTTEEMPGVPGSVSVVLPAKDEEPVIAETVSRCLARLDSIASDYEVVVVDDGSSDRTGAILDKLAAGNPHLHVIHLTPTHGYGAALVTGFKAATKDLVFFMDSDGQFDIADIDKLLVPVQHGYKVAIGYRNERMDSPIRLLNAWAWSHLVSTLFRFKVRDLNCAFKIFDRPLLQSLDTESDGAMINTEILVKLSRLRIPIAEVLVHHYPRKHGKATGANVRVIARAFLELFRLRDRLTSWEPSNDSSKAGAAAVEGVVHNAARPAPESLGSLAGHSQGTGRI